jgi:hypothetical protein
VQDRWFGREAWSVLAKPSFNIIYSDLGFCSVEKRGRFSMYILLLGVSVLKYANQIGVQLVSNLSLDHI